MRKESFVFSALFIFILGLSFFSINQVQVIGQTTTSSSSSSSSSGDVATSSSSSSSSSSGEVVSSSSSSSGEVVSNSSSPSSGEVVSLVCASDSGCPRGTCPDGGTFQKFSCVDGKCNELVFVADPCTVFTPVSSSGGTQIALNENFTGVWKAKFPKPTEPIGGGSSSSGGSSSGCIICIQVVPECSSNEVLVPQSCTECAHCASASTSSGAVSTRIAAHISGPSVSRVLILKLCVREGKLEGVINQGGVIEKGKIISQTVLSENEVGVEVQDVKGVTSKFVLKLLGDRQLLVIFEDKDEIEARKLNPFKSCLAPRGPGGRPDKPKPGKGGRPDKEDKGDKGDRPDDESGPGRPDRPDKPDKPDKPDRPDKPGDKPSDDSSGEAGKPDRPDKPDKPDIGDKPDKPDRPDKPSNGSSGESGNPDRPDKPDKPDRPD